MNRLALTLVALVVGTAALAQPPQGGGQGGQGGGRGGRGGRGGGGFGGPGGQGAGGFGGAQGGFGGAGGFGGQGGFGGMMGGMMGMSRDITAVTIPLRAMALYLSLTDAQTGKIALIREDMQEAARPQMPQRRGAPQDPNADPNAAATPNTQGGRPDIQAMMQEMQTNVAKAERKAVTDTNAVLSEPQRTRLALLIKALKSLQDEGVRPEASIKLLLNEDQLTALSRGRKMDNVFTPEQKTIAQGYMSPMGRGGFGGPGGPGGGATGGQGGAGGATGGRGGRGGGGGQGGGN